MEADTAAEGARRSAAVAEYEQREEQERQAARAAAERKAAAEAKISAASQAGSYGCFPALKVQVAAGEVYTWADDAVLLGHW